MPIEAHHEDDTLVVAVAVGQYGRSLVVIRLFLKKKLTAKEFDTHILSRQRAYL